MRVPILDLEAQYRTMRDELDAAVLRVVRSQRFLLGPEVEEFEAAARAALDVREAVAVSSGSDALVCALLALGIGPGHEVVTTPFSFFATVEAILRVGARPHFVDILPETYALDADAVHRTLFRPDVRAVIAVHLYGQPAPVDRLRGACDQYGIALIEDAAQAFGARLGNRAIGGFGTFGCFSFQPSKPLGAFGDAGLVVTDDAKLAARCRQARSHGARAKHQHDSVGGNYRMDALQAAVLRAKLPHLEDWLGARRVHARAYTEAFRDLPGLGTPRSQANTVSSCSLYTVRVLDGRREALRAFLAERGVETAVHYPLPLHRQRAVLQAGYGAHASLPEAERAAREVLCLPLFPELTAEQQEHVIGSVRAFFDQSKRPMLDTYQS